MFAIYRHFNDYCWLNEILFEFYIIGAANFRSFLHFSQMFLILWLFPETFTNFLRIAQYANIW